MPVTPGRRRFGAVCVGGTFDNFHIAHRALLLKACEVGERVTVGISDGKAARKGSAIQPYARRKAAVEDFLSENASSYEIIPLRDRYGPAVSGKYDAIVVSYETVTTAEELNRIRRKRRLRNLEIFDIGMIPAEDGLPVSSTRLRAGEIDREGMLRKMKVAIGSSNPVKVAAVRGVFRKAFPGRKLTFEAIEVDPGVPPEPFGEEVINGALKRAELALQRGGANFGVGIEAGLFHSLHIRGYFDVQFCAIIDRGGRITLGHGPGFQYPPLVIEELEKGKMVSQAMAEMTGIEGVGRKSGVIGYLSKGILVRRKITETAVISALLPRLNPDIYF